MASPFTPEQEKALQEAWKRLFNAQIESTAGLLKMMLAMARALEVLLDFLEKKGMTKEEFLASLKYKSARDAVDRIFGLDWCAFDQEVRRLLGRNPFTD